MVRGLLVVNTWISSEAEKVLKRLKFLTFSWLITEKSKKLICFKQYCLGNKEEDKN